MRDVGRNALLGSFTTAGGSLLGFALRFGMNALLARFIAPEQFGIYAQAAVYATFVSVIQAISFPQALVQLPELPALAPTVRRMTLVSSGLTLLVALGLTPLLAHLQGPEVAHCFLLLLTVNALGAYGLTYELEIQRAHRWHTAAGMKLGANLLSVALLVPLGILFPGPLVLVLRDGLAPLVMMVAVLIIRHRLGLTTARGPTYDRETARAVWNLGRGLFWNRALEIVFHKIDSALVGALLGQRTLGLYDQARYIANLPNAALGPVVQTVGLRLYAALDQDPSRRRRTFELLDWGISRAGLLFALGALVAPDLAIRVVYGPAWLDAAPILQAFGLWCALMPLSVNHQVLLTAAQDWRPIRVGFAAALGTLLAALPLLSGPFGVLGVALSHTLAIFAELLVRARGTARLLTLAPFTTARRGLPLMLALAIGVAASILLGPLMPAGHLGAALRLLVGLIALALTLLGFDRGRTLAELRYMRDLIRRRS
jgi:O-antigen/teichoic acid export membrane protein